MPPLPPDCDLRRALSPHQRAALTGFSGRAVRALAHLRAAWCVADPGNRFAVEEAIRSLLTGHSLREIPDICRDVLRYGLEQHQAITLLVRVGVDRVERVGTKP